MSKVITTSLVDEDLHGVVVATISNRICQAYIIPRTRLSWLGENEQRQTLEDKSVLYLLIKEGIAGSKPQAYIGQTDNILERVKQHENKKSFWEKIILFTSSDGSATSSEVRYLERKAIEQAQQVGTYDLKENKQKPQARTLPGHRRVLADDFFEDVKLLASFVGCRIFEKVPTTSSLARQTIFFLKRRGANAQGVYNQDGSLTVLGGSKLAKDVTPSCPNKEDRAKIISNLCLIGTDGPTLNTDQAFDSPSGAAAFVLGCSANGRIEWRDEYGRTLDAVYPRKK